MKEGYRDPTHTNACGNAQQEWVQMAKLALKVRDIRANPSFVNEKEKLFTGIFRRLLTDPIDEVQKEAYPRKRYY